MGGIEKNKGFQPSFRMVRDAVYALLYGDLIMRCLYRVRPYELTEGSANELRDTLMKRCISSLTDRNDKTSYRRMCHTIVQSFDELPIRENLKKPRVGIVGEILVKYMPLANNHLVELLEREGAEAVVPDFIDFANYCMYNERYKRKYYGYSRKSVIASNSVLRIIERLRKPANDALKKSKRFDVPASIEDIAEMTKPILSLGNQYGEGWFLTGEMVELITHGAPNIVCIQPFACLPNHVVGKGVIKKLREIYPQANIVAVDYDPGASEVNQLNRIKLMLSVAKERM